MNNYNPDVLSCIANLSNDEVFTSPKLANDMLDLLPIELWRNPEATFLDPCSKSGVFLREITRRLMEGLIDQIPDRQERLDHILKNQVFGISITHLTSFLSRRSLYCSKAANGKYSITPGFDTVEGNVFFDSMQHTWKQGSCIYCGASQSEYDRDDILETHAYQFIHDQLPAKIQNMKFDVIIGNPPYQLNTGSSSAQATPLYDKFVQQAKKLNPRYLSMIIPSRWYSGGMGLNAFRSGMLNDKNIRILVDYPNAKDCFPGIELRGGVCYFVWDRDNSGECEYTNISNGSSNTIVRDLSQYSTFIRWNQALQIVKKINDKKEGSLAEIISTVSPFGLPTSLRGKTGKSKDSLVLHSSGGVGYISPNEIKTGVDLINKYKVLISQTISGNMEVPPFKVIAILKVLKPKEVCTHSYLIAGASDDEDKAQNLKSYLETKFVRLLLTQSVSGIHISRNSFVFVPLQDFSEPWTDEKLYKKYNLNQEEIDFIESMIRPME
jgi:site-specific DNA-methyltransferase (adenine-specific)